MIIKYCNRCIGKPYTTDISKENCPVCNGKLRMESVDDYELENREEFVFSAPVAEEEAEFPAFVTPSTDDFDAADERGKEEDGRKEKKHWYPQQKNEKNDVIEIENINGTIAQEESFDNSDMCICGRVSQYSSTGREDGGYRRLLPVRIYQALVYRQRLEDVLHRFTVRVKSEKDVFGDEAYTDIPVNVHGTISGGLQLKDNAEVEVRGKYRRGILMATSIHIINNGHRSKVCFQRDIRTIMNSVIAAAMLMFLIYVSANSTGGFVESFVYMLKVWGIMAVIVTVLWAFVGFSRFSLIHRMMSGKQRPFPLLGIMIVSLALAFLLVSTFGSFTGFGGYIAAELQSLIVVVAMIAIVLFLLKFLIFR